MAANRFEKGKKMNMKEPGFIGYIEIRLTIWPTWITVIISYYMLY